MPKRRSSLQPFSFDIEVDPQTGRQDKLELECRNILRIGSIGDEIENLKDNLAVVPVSSGEFQNENDYLGAEHGWIFNRPSHSRNFVHIRKNDYGLGSGNVVGAPLFGGICSFKKMEDEEEGSSVTFASFSRLELNPTRFLRHQFPKGPPHWNDAGKELHMRRRGLPEILEEYSLDLRSDGRAPSDNWIPDRLRYEKFIMGRGWNRMLRRYVEGVFQSIVSEFERAGAFQALSIDAHLGASCHLRTVETYWEFRSAEPIKTVYEIQPLIASYGERIISLRHYPKIRRVDDLTKHHNSPVLSILIKDGVKLTIYAKTSRRIRIEVRHDLRKEKTLLNHHRSERGTARTPEQLLPLMEDAREAAAEIVNSVFAFMRRRKSFPIKSASPLRFVADFIEAVGNSRNARLLLSMLIHNGRIVGDVGIRSHVLALRKAGILASVPRNNRRGHEVTEKYRQALAVLRKTDLPMLGIRKRTGS